MARHTHPGDVEAERDRARLMRSTKQAPCAEQSRHRQISQSGQEIHVSYPEAELSRETLKPKMKNRPNNATI
ncbi:hypothetical protein [Salipiger thiooxidans]|uniref:hypothetical protein n=1 Tax=Salipiger thiooxidans TaxID=282683 RepID=UPI001CD2603E|nr:hypothetical protein [Salipiger thiooxidans]MCA0847003.1 hypothetical protein [Salipiger thiooxidans]